MDLPLVIAFPDAFELVKLTWTGFEFLGMIYMENKDLGRGCF